jgi:phosphoribosylformylglycinamidine cyclo-ligase
MSTGNRGPAPVAGPQAAGDRSAAIDYKSAGVDIDAGNEVVRRIRTLARSTFSPAVLSDIGSFGGLFRFDTARYREPVLVSSADGVGTKLRVAFLAGRHTTVGADLVNHCVNDILVQGAEPLFFLDYLATGRLAPDVAAAVVEGVARACRENGCALLGGETAEMPGFYAEGEYDLAGFIVGVVERERLIDGTRIAPGDVLLGLPSSGLHTNGYSLARRILFEKQALRVDSWLGELGASVADVLLAEHRSYLPVIRPLLSSGRVKGLVHITGGGLTDNIPRVLPPGTSAAIDRSAWTVPPLFRYLERAGGVPDDDLYRTFNMGIGLVVICDAADAPSLLARFAADGEPGARQIGRVVAGDPAVRYTG